MMKCEWILYPVCGSKTRNKIRKDTVLEKGENMEQPQ